MQSKTALQNKTWSHIYVEDRVMADPMYRKRAEKILSHFREASVIRIDHYKDVFNRHKQNYMKQHESQALILAVKQGNLVYSGAEVCQSMGNEHFYYTSCMMNCLFDCEYCYLKGMYPSGNMVIFLNLEDIFAEVEALLREHPVYLCVSYDTDLMAVEALTGYVGEWIRFTNEHKDLIIEVRTKAGNIDFEKLLKCTEDNAGEKEIGKENIHDCTGKENPVISHACVCDGDEEDTKGKDFNRKNCVSERNIFAFTLSPDYVVEHYEHKTGTLESRLKSIGKALEMGFTVRLCFDPMIYCPDWRVEYGRMLEKVFSEIPMEKIHDVSVGSFRLSEEYLKSMRRNMPGSAVVQYPYENDHGVYHYSRRLTEEMERWLALRLTERIPEEKIFRWD